MGRDLITGRPHRGGFGLPLCRILESFGDIFYS
mgnify:CR=1 FL=1